MEIGIDVIDVCRFSESLLSGGNSFLINNFSEIELKNKDHRHLAGLFALKEAVFKTGYLVKPNNKSIQIISSASGKPHVYDNEGCIIPELLVSISHSLNTAVGVALWKKV